MSETDELRRAGRLLLSLLEFIHGMHRNTKRGIRLEKAWADELYAARRFVQAMQAKYGEAIMSHTEAIKEQEDSCRS